MKLLNAIGSFSYPVFRDNTYPQPKLSVMKQISFEKKFCCIALHYELLPIIKFSSNFTVVKHNSQFDKLI
jgi:hypothetical protein